MRCWWSGCRSMVRGSMTGMRLWRGKDMKSSRGLRHYRRAESYFALPHIFDRRCILSQGGTPPVMPHILVIRIGPLAPLFQTLGLDRLPCEYLLKHLLECTYFGCCFCIKDRDRRDRKNGNRDRNSYDIYLTFDPKQNWNRVQCVRSYKEIQKISPTKRSFLLVQNLTKPSSEPQTRKPKAQVQDTQTTSYSQYTEMST